MVPRAGGPARVGQSPHVLTTSSPARRDSSNYLQLSRALPHLSGLCRASSVFAETRRSNPGRAELVRRQHSLLEMELGEDAGEVVNLTIAGDGARATTISGGD